MVCIVIHMCTSFPKQLMFYKNVLILMVQTVTLKVKSMFYYFVYLFPFILSCIQCTVNAVLNIAISFSNLTQVVNNETFKRYNTFKGKLNNTKQSSKH